MLENDDDLKTPLKNTMQIAIIHPNPQQNDLSKKILERAVPEFKDRLKFTSYSNYKDIYKDLNKLPFIQESQTFNKGLLNTKLIDELYNKRPALIIYYHFIPNGANKPSEEKKIFETLAEIKKQDELVYIILFIISKDMKENPYNFNADLDKPFNLRKIVSKELIFEFPDDNIWKMIDMGNIYSTVLHYTRLYYRVYKIKIKDKKIKSALREEKIECNLILGILSIIKSKKLVYSKSKYFDEAYYFISDKNYDKSQFAFADKTLNPKFKSNELRATADWLFYKIMKLSNNKLINTSKTQNQNNAKNTTGYSLTDSLMKKQPKNKNDNIENEYISKFLFHIKSFSFLDKIIQEDKNDSFILIEYFWLLQRYKDLTELMEENVQVNSTNKKKIINLLTTYLKQIFYYIKMMKFYSKKNLENPIVNVKNKELNINKIDTEYNIYFGKTPVYSYKDINNPLVKFELGFNEDIYIKKFIALKKINNNGPMKELFEKYLSKIPSLLKNLRLNKKNINCNGGIDLYMNLLKISLLLKENKNIFSNIDINITEDIFNILNNSDYININLSKKFPKIYMHYLELYIKSLIYQLNNPNVTNSTKTKLFINLSLIGNIRKLKEEEENTFFQLINDENFIPELTTKDANKKNDKVFIKLDSDKNNLNPLFCFDYKLNGDEIHEKKILDLVQYNFQLKTNLSKGDIKLNNLKVYILCINEDEYVKDKNHKKEIMIKEYTKEELSSFDLKEDSPINLEHKIFMKYKKGKIYLTQVEFSLDKKENIIYKIDLPINLNKMIFITNLNKKVLDIKIPKEKLTVGLNQFNKFEIEVNKEEIDEVQISQFKMSFINIPSYYKKSVLSTSMKTLLNTKIPSGKTGQYSAKVTEQIFGIAKSEKKQESLIGLVPPEKSGTSKAKTTIGSSMQSFFNKTPAENKQNVNINNNTNKAPMFPNTKTTSTQAQQQNVNVQSEIIQVQMPPPIFYYYNEENNSLDNIEKNYEKEYTDFESKIKSGKNKLGVLMKFSLTGQYEIKLNISYSIRHRDIEDYIWFTQEETLKFIVIEPFKLSTERDSSNVVRKTKTLPDKREEKLTEFFSEQKVQMNIILTNQLNEDIIIKDIIIQLNEDLLGEKNKDIKLKCPIKDIIDSDSLPSEIKNQILKIIKMADYNIPFETKFNGEFKGSIGKFILKWTTPSLLNYERGNLEINNENVIDFPDVSINSQRLKFDYKTFTNENNEIMLNISIENVTNDSIKILFIIENGQEINFIVSGVTKQVHNIKANEMVNLIFRLIPLIRNEELKLPVIKICEMNFDSIEKICSNYYFLDKIYIV